MPRVLITDNLSPAGLKSLKDAGLEVDVRSGLKPLEVREAKEAVEAMARTHGIVFQGSGCAGMVLLGVLAIMGAAAWFSR